MKKLALVLCLIMALTGCSKEVPDKPKDNSSAVEVSAFEGLETKNAVFERVGEFTYPIDYVMSGDPGDYKLRDSIYYSLYLTNRLSPPAKTLDEFSEYVSSIAKVSLREYKKVYAEEVTLDGCQSFYVEGYGKDSNKYKYVVFMGIRTTNGMTLMSAVINEEDWETKGALCKEIMMSFKNNGMVDPSELRASARPKTLKPTVSLPTTWKLVKDENNTKTYKNAANSIEFTIFFGKQDDASLDNIMSNNAVTWKTDMIDIQGFEAREARGLYEPAITEVSSSEESSSKGSGSKSSSSSEAEDLGPKIIPGTLDYYAYEITQGGYRCIVATVTKTDVVTPEDSAELQQVLKNIQLYQQEETLEDDEPDDSEESNANEQSEEELTDEITDGVTDDSTVEGQSNEGQSEDGQSVEGATAGESSGSSSGKSENGTSSSNSQNASGTANNDIALS